MKQGFGGERAIRWYLEGAAAARLPQTRLDDLSLYLCRFVRAAHWGPEGIQVRLMVRPGQTGAAGLAT